MTVTLPTTQPAATGRIPVFDHCGRIVATVGASRSHWMGVLLAECNDHHIYLVDPDDPWGGCPICNEAA